MKCLDVIISLHIRLELAVNALAGIFADVIVVHGHFKRRVNNGVDAVSYTHLDVYKRQP